MARLDQLGMPSNQWESGHGSYHMLSIGISWLILFFHISRPTSNLLEVVLRNEGIPMLLYQRFSLRFGLQFSPGPFVHDVGVASRVEQPWQEPLFKNEPL